MNKVIDCFTFFNELDLLEIRLKYLYDTVDYFVIIESDKSFNGDLKEMVFSNNNSRFDSFKDKIVYVPIKMKNFDLTKGVAWKREEFQRNCIQEGLDRVDLNDDDLILISDIDEFPNKDIILDFKINNGDKTKTTKKSMISLVLKSVFCAIKTVFYKIINKDTQEVTAQFKVIYLIVFKNFSYPLNFEMFNYYYYLNYQKKDSYWFGIQGVQAKWLKVFTPNQIRVFRKTPVRTVKGGGWHFSYLGGKEMIKYKIKNFSHQEYNIPEIVSDDYIDFCIQNGYSLFEYYKNSNAKPKYVKLDISHLPTDLKNIVVDYKNLLVE